MCTCTCAWRGELTGWRAGQGLSNTAQVDDDGLDAVAFALDLGLQALHLVAVERIGDIAADVDVGHGCGGSEVVEKLTILLMVKQTGVYRRVRNADDGGKRHAVHALFLLFERWVVGAGP
jgi:hypothetical protein